MRRAKHGVADPKHSVNDRHIKGRSRQIDGLKNRVIETKGEPREQAHRSRQPENRKEGAEGADDQRERDALPAQPLTQLRQHRIDRPALNPRKTALPPVGHAFTIEPLRPALHANPPPSLRIHPGVTDWKVTSPDRHACGSPRPPTIQTLKPNNRMRIIYGVSGEGLGHVYEAIEIAEMLQREGHSVKILTFGDRALEALKGFSPSRIEGFPLHVKANQMSVWRTALRNRHTLTFYVRHWRRLRRELEAFEPDVFLTAYEPYTTLMSHVLRRPLISMDNQNGLRYLRRAPVGSAMELAVVRIATRLCTLGAAFYLIKSYRPLTPDNPRDRIVAPIVQRDIRALNPAVGAHFLVYLTKPNPEFVDVLRELDEPCVIYCHDRVGDEGKLRFRPRGAGFLDDLASCRAIIGTAGFSLIADAIFLKKPYFAVPLRKQFEQTMNALFLADSGLGAYSESPTVGELRQFIADLPRYTERLEAQRFDPTEQEKALCEVLGRLARRRAVSTTDASPLFSAVPRGKGSCSQEKA